jgi:predicted transcriptional regulator
MFEQLLREMILMLLREDTDIRTALVTLAAEGYDKSVRNAVKFAIENDEQVQDVIRKQATMDIGELIVDTLKDLLDGDDDDITSAFNKKIVDAIDHDMDVASSIRFIVSDKIETLNFEVTVR